MWEGRNLKKKPSWATRKNEIDRRGWVTKKETYPRPHKRCFAKKLISLKCEAATKPPRGGGTRQPKKIEKVKLGVSRQVLDKKNRD